MDMETFQRAINCGDDVVYIGGGEPTMHPKFDAMLMEALGSSSIEHLGITTNGTHPRRSLALANMTANGTINASLSFDQYHDHSMVRDDVRQAFGRLNGGQNGIRNIGRNGVVAAGRGAEVTGASEGCACEDILVQPDGQVRYCGCLEAPIIGDVWSSWDMPYYSDGRCYRDLPNEDEEDEEEEGGVGEW